MKRINLKKLWTVSSFCPLDLFNIVDRSLIQFGFCSILDFVVGETMEMCSVDFF